jgi:drug/metabolite transporter (DMT)-like permease
VIGLAVVPTLTGFIVFFALINEIGPVRTIVVTYVNPAVALVLGVALLNEPFTLGLGVGFPLVIAGSVLATRRRRLTPTASAPIEVAGPDPTM